MPRLIVTAQVEDSAKWLEVFETHGDLFRAMGTTEIRYAARDQDEVALYVEVDDLEKYFEMMQSSETAEAMAADGVNRESVKVFVLDREWRS